MDAGLRSVHNDTCYPALLVIGQMIDALEFLAARNSGEIPQDRAVVLLDLMVAEQATPLHLPGETPRPAVDQHLLPGAAGDRADDRRARIGEI